MSKLGQLSILLTLENSRFLQEIARSEQNARKFTDNARVQFKSSEQYKPLS